MSIYKTSSRILTKTGRKDAFRTLGMLAEHMDSLGVDVTAIAFAAGDLTVTTDKPIDAAQAAHLGLTFVS